LFRGLGCNARQYKTTPALNGERKERHTRNEESDHVIDDALVAKLLTSFGILGVYHGVQEIFLVVWTSTASFQEIASRALTLFDVYLEVLVLLGVEGRWQR
jgi:hypothetical protein